MCVCVRDCVRPNIHARSCKFNHQKGSKRHLTSSHSARRGPTSSLRRDLSPVPSRSSQSSPSEKLHPRDSLPKRKVSASVCSLSSLNCWKYCIEGIWRAGDWCCSGFLNVMECYGMLLNHFRNYRDPAVTRTTHESDLPGQALPSPQGGFERG